MCDIFLYSLKNLSQDFISSICLFHAFLLFPITKMGWDQSTPDFPVNFFYVGGFILGIFKGFIPFLRVDWNFFPVFSGWADVKLTHEQQRILSHKIEPGQTVKIIAFAGKSPKRQKNVWTIPSLLLPSLIPLSEGL